MERWYLESIRLRRPLPPESYLAALPAVRSLRQGERLTFHQGVTFLVGENGTGKSTLLEAIAVACGFNPEGGSRNFSFSTRATHSELHGYLSVSRQDYPRDGFFLRAESFYNAASYLDELAEEVDGRALNSYGGVSLHRQSHGESFLSLIGRRFGGNGLYLLDEPEAALSPSRLLELLAWLRELERRRSQFVIATHSPILMTYPGARIYQLSERGIETVDYRNTEHYRLTKRFLEDPERMLRDLLED